jgi:hypothetical protein
MKECGRKYRDCILEFVWRASEKQRNVLSQESGSEGRGLKADLRRDLKAGLLEYEKRIHKRSNKNVGKSDNYTKQNNWLNKQIGLTITTKKLTK